MVDDILFNFSKPYIRSLVDKLAQNFHRVRQAGSVEVFLLNLKHDVFILVHDLTIGLSQLIQVSDGDGTLAFDEEELDVIDCFGHL